MSEKKNIVVYSLLTAGHLNVCASLATVILNKNSDKVDVHFIVDEEWREKLSKIDGRFKFAVMQRDKQKQAARREEMMKKILEILKLPLADRVIKSWGVFFTADNPIFELDKQAEEKIRKIKPDLMLCDQICLLPAMQLAPAAHIQSANPLGFSFEGYPKIGCDAGVDEKEKIKEFDDKVAESRENSRKLGVEIFEKRGFKYPETKNSASSHFNIYAFPAELDYYTNSELKNEYNLWQIDTPLGEDRVPKPFELPEEFAKLPGKIVYFSWGTVFGYFEQYVQRALDALDKVPDCKFIVSKGQNGDKIKFPSSKFIGENYVDQLAILQVADLMIGHGGNNSLAECFYFGVPTILMPFNGDQINNGKRVEETGYGYQVDPMNYTDEQLVETVRKALADEKLKIKMKTAAQRVRKEKRIEVVADQVVDYLNKI